MVNRSTKHEIPDSPPAPHKINRRPQGITNDPAPSRGRSGPPANQFTQPTKSPDGHLPSTFERTHDQYSDGSSSSTIRSKTCSQPICTSNTVATSSLLAPLLFRDELSKSQHSPAHTRSNERNNVQVHVCTNVRSHVPSLLLHDRQRPLTCPRARTPCPVLPHPQRMPLLRHLHATRTIAPLRAMRVARGIC
jgi:hypothetical protein